uniref:HYR domain-containing protein n=1 Tax=Mariniflexile sp. TaxID=1979402 RepID=UPI004048E955
MPPIFVSCAAPVSVTVDTDSCEALATNVNLGTPTASDNCSAVTLTNNAPLSFPLGTTTVIWTATDASGNTATCEQTVTVTDNMPPVFVSCAADVSVTVDTDSCEALTINVNLGTPTASDNCSAVTLTNNAPLSFPLGTTTVTWTATDASGNTATCEQTVTVTDNMPPIFVSCAAPVSVT